jgi:hypothetical protein
MTSRDTLIWCPAPINDTIYYIVVYVYTCTVNTWMQTQTHGFGQSKPFQISNHYPWWTKAPISNPAPRTRCPHQSNSTHSLNGTRCWKRGVIIRPGTEKSARAGSCIISRVQPRCGWWRLGPEQNYGEQLRNPIKEGIKENESHPFAWPRFIARHARKVNPHRADQWSLIPCNLFPRIRRGRRDSDLAASVVSCRKPKTASWDGDMFQNRKGTNEPAACSQGCGDCEAHCVPV